MHQSMTHCSANDPYTSIFLCSANADAGNAGIETSVAVSSTTESGIHVINQGNVDASSICRTASGNTDSLDGPVIGQNLLSRAGFLASITLSRNVIMEFLLDDTKHM